jgi:hypothetical protein
VNPDCWNNDHTWHGGGICTLCGERLRCICGQFVTVDGFDAHAAVCPVLRRLVPEPVGEGL